MKWVLSRLRSSSQEAFDTFLKILDEQHLYEKIKTKIKNKFEKYLEVKINDKQKLKEHIQKLNALDFLSKEAIDKDINVVKVRLYRNRKEKHYVFEKLNQINDVNRKYKGRNKHQNRDKAINLFVCYLWLHFYIELKFEVNPIFTKWYGHDKYMSEESYILLCDVFKEFQYIEDNEQLELKIIFVLDGIISSLHIWEKEYQERKLKKDE